MMNVSRMKIFSSPWHHSDSYSILGQYGKWWSRMGHYKKCLQIIMHDACWRISFQKATSVLNDLCQWPRLKSRRRGRGSGSACAVSRPALHWIMSNVGLVQFHRVLAIDRFTVKQFTLTGSIDNAEISSQSSSHKARSQFRCNRRMPRPCIINDWQRLDGISHTRRERIRSLKNGLAIWI